MNIPLAILLISFLIFFPQIAKSIAFSIGVVIALLPLTIPAFIILTLFFSLLKH